MFCDTHDGRAQWSRIIIFPLNFDMLILWDDEDDDDEGMEGIEGLYVW